MAYVVKETAQSQLRQYALEGIVSDLQQNLLAGTALVREERQNFWYSVNELAGVVPTPAFRFVCAQCKAMVSARKIDIGLTIQCSRCKGKMEVPDVKARQQAMADKHVLKQANQKLGYGAVLFLGGIGTTATSCISAMNQRDSGYVVFWGLIVVGAGMMIQAHGQRRLYFKKYPQGPV